MARGVAVDLVTRDYVTVARSRGEPVRSIVWRELTPNATGVLLVEFGVRAGYAPILISSLGFLGFGCEAALARVGPHDLREPGGARDRAADACSRRVPRSRCW